MLWTAVAVRRIGQLPWIGSGVLNELLERFHRDFRMRSQKVRLRRDTRDHLEILHRIVGQLRIQPHVERERAVAAHEQRVAVWRALRRGVGADVAVRAGLVLDHHRLAEGLRHFSADQARQEVVAAARGEGRDDVDRPVRIGLRRSGRTCACEQHGRNEQSNDACTGIHGGLPGRLTSDRPDFDDADYDKISCRCQRPDRDE